MAVHNAREFGGRAAISYLLEKVAEPPPPFACPCARCTHTTGDTRPTSAGMVVKVNSPHKAMRESRARVARRVHTAGARARPRRRRLLAPLEQAQVADCLTEADRLTCGERRVWPDTSKCHPSHPSGSTGSSGGVEGGLLIVWVCPAQTSRAPSLREDPSPLPAYGWRSACQGQCHRKCSIAACSRGPCRCARVACARQRAARPHPSAPQSDERMVVRGVVAHLCLSGCGALAEDPHRDL